MTTTSASSIGFAIRRALLLLPLAALATACGKSQPGKAAFVATDITGSALGGDLALTDHTGKSRTLGDYRGKVVMVFFGYTNCPDVCPTTLSEAARTLKLLGAARDRVQVLFVTIDPERDTQEVLARFVTAFDPSFVALRGDLDAVRRAAGGFKVFFEKRPTGKPGEYAMDHTAATFVMDADGRARLLLTPGLTPEQVAADLRHLLG